MKMWYAFQWDNSPSMSQFVKVNHYKSEYGVLAHFEQQAIKGPKLTSVKIFIQENK